MSRIKEYMLKLQEAEKANIDIQQENMDDEYWYELYIQKKYKSPKCVAFMKNSEGKTVMLQGDTPDDIYKIAEKHHLEGEFQIMSPTLHLF